MEVRGFQALPFTGTNGLQQDVVEGTPLDFLNLMMTEEMMELHVPFSLPPSLSLSLSLSLSNKRTETYSESKKTHASVALGGACEVINSQGGGRGGPWSRPLAGHLVLSAIWSAISKLFIETKLSFLQGEFGY